MLPGQSMCGASVSLTMMLNVFVTEFPLGSVARQVTTVVPFWKVEPEGGTQTISNCAGQLSVAPGSKFTTALQLPGSVVRGRSPGRVSLGASRSSTFTRNEQEAWFPAASVAVQVTGVEPVLNVDPDGG